MLVDDEGEVVSGSTTTAILAAAMLARHPGEAIVYNVICSKAVPEVIRELGGKPVKSRVGHSFMKQVMADTDAVLGGEHSAHYYFRENFRADSGIIAALDRARAAVEDRARRSPSCASRTIGTRSRVRSTPASTIRSR